MNWKTLNNAFRVLKYVAHDENFIDHQFSNLNTSRAFLPSCFSSANDYLSRSRISYLMLNESSSFALRKNMVTFLDHFQFKFQSLEKVLPSRLLFDLFVDKATRYQQQKGENELWLENTIETDRYWEKFFNVHDEFASRLFSNGNACRFESATVTLREPGKFLWNHTQFLHTLAVLFFFVNYSLGHDWRLGRRDPWTWDRSVILFVSMQFLRPVWNLAINSLSRC